MGVRDRASTTARLLRSVYKKCSIRGLRGPLNTPALRHCVHVRNDDLFRAYSGMIPRMNKHEIFQSIAADVAKGDLAFPTSARVAIQVQQALNDPECEIGAAVKLVQAEPLLAARIVAMANSVAFNRSGREVTEVKTAVTRLGFKTVRSLAAALVTRQMAGGPGAATQQELASRLWEHTTHVASLAHVIARHVTHVDPDTAMFAGIVHEVGGFYLLSRANDFPGLLEGGFDEWLDTGETEVGRAVLKMLAVPEPVQQAVDVYFEGALEIPSTSLGDTLMLAEQLAPVRSPLHRRACDEGVAETAASIDMVIGEETLAGILKESAAEVASLIAALKF